MSTTLFIIVLIILIVLIVLINNKMNHELFTSSNKNNDDKYNYIYLIRHSEKVSKDNFGLSPIGVTHSNCLINYFKNFPLGIPKYSITKMSNNERPIQTANIISNKLNIENLKLPQDYELKQDAKIILEKLAEYENILVVWQHHLHIPTLANILGCQTCNSWSSNPTSEITDGKLFNNTWVMRYPKLKSYCLENVDQYKVELFVFDQNFEDEICKMDFNYVYKKY